MKQVNKRINDLNNNLIHLKLLNLTPEQKKVLIEFVNEHPELVPNLLKVAKKMQKIINSNDIRAWKKFFNDYKQQMKNK